jgi:hypothetical protein
MRAMRRGATVFLTVCLFAIAGCGGDDDDDGSDARSTTPTPTAEVSDADRAAIEESLTGYFGGDTAAKVCDWMTAGLQAQIAGRGAVGDPAEPATGACAREIERVTDAGQFSLEPVQPELEAVAVDQRLAAVRVSGTQSEPEPVFLVESGGKWLVQGEGQAPPGYEDLAAQVEG